MSTATVIKYDKLDRNWNHVSISPEIGDSSAFDTTNSSYTVILTFDNTVHWTGVGSISDPSDYILVRKGSFLTADVHYSFYNNTHGYYFTINQGDTYDFQIYLRADVVEKPLKIKKLFEKITDKFLYFEKIGMAAEIHGKNSAGTGDCSLATTFKNPLAGQCQGVLYEANGTATADSTSTQQNSAFVVTPSTGKIKVLEKGHYLVIASAYAYTGFTANDSFDFYVQVNGSGTARLRAVEKMSGTYQIIYLIQTVGLAANAELNIAVANTTAARGIVTSGLPTTLQVMRLN